MILSIDEIVVHVKKEIMRDLFVDADNDRCLIDIWIEDGSVDKSITKVSKYFLDTMRERLLQVYSNQDLILYRKYGYEYVLDLYLKEKYNVKEVGLEIFFQAIEREAEEKYVLQNIKKFTWKKERRVSAIRYRALTDKGKRLYIEVITIRKNKESWKNYQILYDNRPFSYAEVNCDMIVNEIESTHPIDTRANNIIIIDKRYAYFKSEQERKRKNEEKREAKKKEKENFEKSMDIYYEMMAERYDIKVKQVKKLVNRYSNECLSRTKNKYCKLSNGKRCNIFSEYCKNNKILNEELIKLSKREKTKIHLSKEHKKIEIQKENDINTLRKIDVRDFVVRRDVFKCMHNTHIISDIDAVIMVVDNEGKQKAFKISAGYCAQCNIYFIMDSVYQNLKRQGIILCRITDEKTYLKGGFMNGAKLAQESILMQYGYNVSQMEGLSATRRQKILAVIIDNKVLSKNEIISYLDFFIRQHGRRSNMELAVAKWEDDRDFVEHYRIGEYTQYGVNAIHRR